MTTAASRPENETDFQSNEIQAQVQQAIEAQVTARYTRLSVNLSLDTAEVLKGLARRKGITITDAIPRAIAVWSFVEDELDKGNRIAVVERVNGSERVREVVFVSN
jgi:hypothetical protein